MTSCRFAFVSDNLPKIKAKQLSNAFPYIKLSAAQEATAQALGYISWYQCLHRDKSVVPSASDQVAGLAIRIARYYHQANVLMKLGIPPGEADRWVRAWGLTGGPTLAPMHASPTYYLWANALDKLDRGAVSAEDLVRSFGNEAEYSKYPDVDRPERVCPGVILGPMGKYPHFVVDHQVNARIPAYLRLPNAVYHLEDDGDILAECVPGFSASSMRKKPLRQLNLIQHEWHFGVPHPDSKRSLVQSLISSALTRPSAMVVISIRATPLGDDKFDFDRYTFACLRGVDFAEFLRQKGAFDSANVVWYSNVEEKNISVDFWHELMGLGFDDFDKSLPVFENAHLHTACLPVYSYPFKDAPMSDDEYYSAMERFPLLPLAQDYPEDDDDAGGDNDGDDSDGPLVPRAPREIYDFEPA